MPVKASGKTKFSVLFWSKFSCRRNTLLRQSFKDRKNLLYDFRQFFGCLESICRLLRDKFTKINAVPPRPLNFASHCGEL